MEQMKVTYIHHSSFLVELPAFLLLFDYTEGTLPALCETKPLYVFASHRHGDHFSSRIFELAERHPLVRYILSDDISKRRVPEALLPLVTFVRPGGTYVCHAGEKCAADHSQDSADREAYACCAEEKSGKVSPALKLCTFRSTDEGVAFLLEADGRVIYHAGDLNDWVWAGEPDKDNRRMHEAYLAELKKIAAKGVVPDAAFVPLDPRQEADFSRGLDEFMRIVGAKKVIPMHFWGDFGVIDRMRALPCAEAYRDKIAVFSRDGEQVSLA